MNRLRTRSIRLNYMLLSLIFFILFVIFISIVGKFINEGYEHIKVNKLQSYLQAQTNYNQETLVEVAKLENFTVQFYEDGIAYNDQGKYIDNSKLEVMPVLFTNYKYTTEKGLTYHRDDEKLVLKNDTRYTILSIDNYLHFSLLFIIIACVVSSIFFFIFILFLLVAFTERYILSRIVKLADYLEEGKDINELKFRTNDELTYLLDNFKVYIKQTNDEIENRRILSSAFSHELKNPLANIKAMVFLYEHSPEVFKDYADFAAQINNEVDGITNDINHSLEVFDSDNHKSTEEVDIADVVSSVIGQNEKLCVSKQLHIDCHLSPVIIKTNPVKLMLLINNIVNNAIKHAKVNSNITIKLNQDYLTCTNLVNEDTKRKHTMGNKLINYTADSLNFSLSNNLYNDSYSVMLKFKEH